MAATKGGPAAAAAACIIGGAEAGWCWSERWGEVSLLHPGTCPAAQAPNWIQDMDTSEVPAQLVPCGSEVYMRCTGDCRAHSGLLSAPVWKVLNEYGALVKLEYW